MSEQTLFMFGSGISMLAFSGVLIYAMSAFREWAGRNDTTPSPTPDSSETSR
jgi:hypothetical protein